MYTLDTHAHIIFGVWNVTFKSEPEWLFYFDHKKNWYIVMQQIHALYFMWLVLLLVYKSTYFK